MSGAIVKGEKVGKMGWVIWGDLWEVSAGHCPALCTVQDSTIATYCAKCHGGWMRDV